jgi:hypothetical protein
MRLRPWLVGVLLVGSCAACGGAPDQRPADAYREFIPACSVLPDDVVATITEHRALVAEPLPAEPDMDISSTCRRDFEDDKFSVWVSLHVLRFPAEDGRTGAEQARYWLLSYGTDIAAPPAEGADVDPSSPVPSARTAKDLGFEAVSLGGHWGSATLYAVDGNAAVVIEYGHAPKVEITEDDIPDDDGWRMREATFQLAKAIGAGLRQYRSK